MNDNTTISREIFDTANIDRAVLDSGEGLSKSTVEMISEEKKEPDWMLRLRLKALALFNKTPVPKWGPDLSSLDLDRITYYKKTDDVKNARRWEDVPEDIRNTFEKLGIPEAERKALSGVGAQYESEVLYHKLKTEWAKKGVIFENMDVALQKYPELVRKNFMTRCVPINDHKFAMLHAAVWSGGTFVYVPEGVKVNIPLQAYFRMNAPGMGQFEHTLIIAEKNSEVHYIEGCSAPLHTKNSIHAGCVELHVSDGARLRYSSIENWSRNTFNLNTKRAIVYKDGLVEWLNGNLGSGVTMLYPCSMLIGDRARSDSIGIAFAGEGQNQDTGSKVFHLAPNTTSTIHSKSICKDGGITTYRGHVRIVKGAKNVKCSVNCDALMIDEKSRNHTIPYMDINEEKVDVVHEATVGKLSTNQIFYLMSRGLDEQGAIQMIVSGFIEPVTRELPLEYAVELNRLIGLEMEGSVG